MARTMWTHGPPRSSPRSKTKEGEGPSSKPPTRSSPLSKTKGRVPSSKSPPSKPIQGGAPTSKPPPSKPIQGGAPTSKPPPSKPRLGGAPTSKPPPSKPKQVGAKGGAKGRAKVGANGGAKPKMKEVVGAKPPPSKTKEGNGSKPRNSKKRVNGGGTSEPKNSKKARIGGGERSLSLIVNELSDRDEIDAPSDRDEIDAPSERDEMEVECERDEMDPPSERYEMDPPSERGEPLSDDGDDCSNVGDEDDDATDGFAGIDEEYCADLTIFGGEGLQENCEDKDEDSDDDDIWDEEYFPDPQSSDEENEEEMRPGEAYREDTDPEKLFRLGKTFPDADDFKHACLRYSLKTRYNIKFYRSSALKLCAKCAAQGKPEDAPCPWMIYCSFEKRKQKLMIKTYVNKHTCEKTGESTLLKRSAIASLFSERLRLNPRMTAKQIHAEILREYKMIASEHSCIKAKTKVMKERRKTHEEHFSRIWDYQAEVLDKNPNSTFEIETIPGATIGSKQRFYRLYMCYKSQKESWKKTCRPVIGLDGAFLKWDIKGQLLAAVGRDGDNRIVPIAWAVVEIENDTNWDWFVKLLAQDLQLGDGKDYTIMSDKQKGLVKAIHTVLPEAEHRQCCRHIYENWKKDGKDLRLQRLFWYIARSYTPGMYKHNMDELKEYNPGAHASLLLTKPETWSRAFFRLGSLCNDNLNNLSESFNKTIKDARKKPLLDLLEDIRVQCMTRNFDRRKIAYRLQTKFTKKTHRQLDKIEKKSTECILHWAIGPETEVEYKGHSYVVSMEEHTCACRAWQMNGIPCIHAAKVILAMKLHLSDYVNECYTTMRWRQTYSLGIKPLNGIIEWPQTSRLGVIPPPFRKGNPGRPRNHDRLKGKNETGSKTKLSRAHRIVTCSNCKEEGHNKTTCKNSAVASPAKRPRGRPRTNEGLQFQESQGSQQQFSFTQTSNVETSNAPSADSRWEQSSQDQGSRTRGWAPWFL